MQEAQHLISILTSLWNHSSDTEKLAVTGAWATVAMQFLGILPTLLACLATGSVFVLNAIRIGKELKHSRERVTDDE